MVLALEVEYLTPEQLLQRGLCRFFSSISLTLARKASSKIDLSFPISSMSASPSGLMVSSRICWIAESVSLGPSAPRAPSD